MPYKNAESWIEDTIRSIRTQSFDDWELIAVNDGSTDNSVDLVTEMAQLDNRIRFLQNPGTGIISALQEGLSRSNGDYITRMDADDIMPSNRLGKMLNTLVASPSKTIVTGKVRYFSNEEVSEGYRKYEMWLNERVDNNDHFNHIYRECVIASPNWITRKEDLIEAMIFDQLEYPEDYSMVFLWFDKGFTISSLNETTLEWREHPERTSRNSEIYDQESFFNLKMKWFKQLNLTKEGSIGIIGAGKKGKLVVNHLKDAQHLNWYDLNYRNYNTTILGHEVRDPKLISDDLLLIAVYPDDPQIIQKFIEEKGYEIGRNAWFV